MFDSLFLNRIHTYYQVALVKATRKVEAGCLHH